MDLIFHGGKCCGIKIIKNLGTNPDSFCDELPEIGKDDADKHGEDVVSKRRFFHKSAPCEEKTKRLDRYIEYVKKYRPQHMIEVVIATCPPGSPVHFWQDQSKWIPVLKKRRFKKVTEFLNSNSGNTCHVFHLLVGQPKKERKKKTNEQSNS